MIVLQWQCAFQPPNPWLHSFKTFQVPIRGEIGQRIIPFLLTEIDSITVEAPDALQITIDLARDTLIIRSISDIPAIHLVTLNSGHRSVTLAVETTPRLPVNFHYKSLPGSTHKVSIAGSFNNWNASSHPLLDLDRDGDYEVTIMMDPIEHKYVFMMDGERILDPSNPDTGTDGRGNLTSTIDLREFLDKVTGRFIKRQVDGTTFTFNYEQPDGAAPVNPESITVLVNNFKLPKHQITFNEITSDLAITLHIKAKGSVRILAMDMVGNVCQESQFLVNRGQTITASTPLDTWHTKSIYHAVIDRFFDGNPYNNWHAEDQDIHPLDNYLGGDLEGLTLKIDEGYFNDLGIDALLISPWNWGPDSVIQTAGRPATGFHGYRPAKVDEVDPRIGGRGAARDLMTTAAESHLPVIMDLVTSPFHTTDSLISTAANWIQKFHLSGFNYIGEPGQSYRWGPELTLSLKGQSSGHQLLQITDYANRNDHINASGLDGASRHDFLNSVRYGFSAPSGNMVDVAGTLKDIVASTGEISLMPLHLNSRHTGRFVSYANGDLSFDINPAQSALTRPPTPAGVAAQERYRLYQAFLLTIPGLPIIYYGDEIGMAGAGEPDNMRPMKWNNWTDTEQDTWDNLAKLLHYRRQHPALAVGDLVIDQVTPDLITYRRIGFEEELLVILNKADVEKSVTLPGDGDIYWAELGQSGSVGGDIDIAMAPRSWKIYRVLSRH